MRYRSAHYRSIYSNAVFFNIPRDETLFPYIFNRVLNKQVNLQSELNQSFQIRLFNPDLRVSPRKNEFCIYVYPKITLQREEIFISF